MATMQTVGQMTRTALAAMSVGAVAAGLLVTAPSTAQAGTADQTTIIRGAPTDDRGGSTADQNSVFELRQPPWPGRNECRLDAKNGPFTPCSFYFEADSLEPGSHTLSVRQYDQDGNLTTDTWQWNLLSSSRIAVEPHTYCWIGFDDYTEPSAGRTWARGRSPRAAAGRRRTTRALPASTVAG